MEGMTGVADDPMVLIVRRATFSGRVSDATAGGAVWHQPECNGLKALHRYTHYLWLLVEPEPAVGFVAIPKADRLP